MKPIRRRLLEALERSPMTIFRLAETLGTTEGAVRTRLNEYRRLGAVRVVGKAPQGIYALNVWGVVNYKEQAA